MPKNAQTTVLFSYARKVMVKILQTRRQQYVNWGLPDIKAGFRKGRWTRAQIANIHSIIEIAQDSKKISTSVSLTTLKPLTVWITTNCGIFLKRWEYQTTWPASWEICMQVKKIRNNRLVPNRERSTSRLYIVILLFKFICRVHHWRKKWQPTPLFLPGESQGRGSLVGCRLWGCIESDTTEAT